MVSHAFRVAEARAAHDDVALASRLALVVDVPQDSFGQTVSDKSESRRRYEAIHLQTVSAERRTRYRNAVGDA